MSLIKIDREEVLLIQYNGESVFDSENLKKELQAEAAAKNSRDIVLELVNSAVIYSSEIGVVVQFLKSLVDSKNTLRLVASNYVCEMLKTMNIHKIPNLTLHDNLESAQEHFSSVDLSDLQLA